jgi:DNA adenine methylase
MKAPFGRMGGKSKLAKQLVSRFPSYKIYIEPFVGAGNVFFKQQCETEIINDLDGYVYDVLTGLKNTPDINTLNRYITKDDFNLAFSKNDWISKFIAIKASFFQMPHKGWCGRDMFITGDYLQYQSRLKNVIILNQDFATIIKEYDNVDAFIYLDPPYEYKNPKYKCHAYSDYVSPEQVYAAIQNIKSKFMISYNDSPKIRQIFEKYNISEIQTIYNGTKYLEKRKKIELIITNY